MPFGFLLDSGCQVSIKWKQTRVSKYVEYLITLIHQLATSLAKIEFYFGSVTGTRSHADHFGTKNFEKKY